MTASPLEIDVENLEHEEALKFVKRFQVLLEINQSINSTMELESLLRTIIDVAALVMNAEASSLALLDQASEELVFHLAEGEAGKTVESLRLPKGKGIAGWVQENAQPVIVPDVSKDERFYKGVDEKSKFQTRSIICVPMMRSGNRTIGVLQVLNKKDGTFDNDDLILFMSLANIAAIAVENSQLYQVLQQTLQQVKQDNLHLNNVLAKLEQSESEVRRMKDSVDANQDGDFVGSLSTFSPPNILQMLGNDMKTGHVHLKTPTHEGHIYFETGQIYHAELATPPLVGGSAAIYEMMGWVDGSFSYNEGNKTENRTVDMGAVMPLMIEGLRRMDEVAVLKENFPPDCLANKTNHQPPEDMDPERLALFERLESGQSLDTLWAADTLDSHTFYSAIEAFCNARMLELEAPA